MINLDAMVGPVAADAPGGPDLSYAPDRLAIEQAFDMPSEEVDWPRIIALIEAQALLTRDAWLAVYLARAGAQASDLQTVEYGCGLLAGLFEQCWDTLHPDLADYGIEGRKGACESLVRIGGFLAPLRRVPLIRHARLGDYSGADFVRYASEGSEATGYGQFRAAVADTPTEQLEGALNALARIRAAIERADIFLSEQAQTAGHTGTNFQPTYDALDELTGALRPFVSQPAEILGEHLVETESAPAAGTAMPGRVNSRADAARAIDAVIDYYLRAEPSSPIPVGLTRIKGWITMDFMAILNDIAPGSLSEAAGVLRTRGGGDASDLM